MKRPLLAISGRRRAGCRAGLHYRSARVTTAGFRRRPAAPHQAGHERRRAHEQAHPAQADSSRAPVNPLAHRARARPPARLRPRPREAVAGGARVCRRASSQVREGRDQKRPECAGSAPEHDRIARTRPSFLSQLHICAETLAMCPSFALVTWQERTARYAFTRRGRAMIATRTSQCRSRVERFVIERFTPRCLVDIEPVRERVISASLDAVGSILESSTGDTCGTEGTRAGATGL